jgi:hypothetical protein
MDQLIDDRLERMAELGRAVDATAANTAIC